MLIFGVNFNVYFLLYMKKISQALRCEEMRWYLGIIAAATTLICVNIYDVALTFEHNLRNAFFQVSTIITTTGFATDDYMQWPPYLWMLLSFVMFFGACSGSSTGAMKCGRVAILAKSIRGEFRRILHPNAVIPVRMDGNPISQGTRATVLTFTCLYFLLILGGWFVFMFLGLDFVEGYSISVSCVGNIGPALGTLGPAYSWSALPESAKWLSALLMLIGRLEIFGFIQLFFLRSWR